MLVFDESSRTLAFTGSRYDDGPPLYTAQHASPEPKHPALRMRRGSAVCMSIPKVLSLVCGQFCVDAQPAVTPNGPQRPWLKLVKVRLDRNVMVSLVVTGAHASLSNIDLT